MTETKGFVSGAEVACSDGECGVLRRIIVDPVAGVLTHLVVEPKHRHGAGHLVPIHLVDTEATGIRLTCTAGDFNALDPAQETRFVADPSGQWGYGPGQVLAWPYYRLGGAEMAIGGLGLGSLGLGGGMGLGGELPAPRTITGDNRPNGKVEIHRGESIHAADGEIGRVQGFVVDPSDRRLTHVLLGEGHLWRKKTVSIPIELVARVEGGVHVALTKDQVRDLPTVNLVEGRHWRSGL
jgi:sporulation protein YlmC with PRC-barrel domain